MCVDRLFVFYDTFCLHAMDCEVGMEVDTEAAATEVNGNGCVSSVLCVWCNDDVANDKLQVLQRDGLATFVSRCNLIGRHDLVSLAQSKNIGELKLHRFCRLKLWRAAKR